MNLQELVALFLDSRRRGMTGARKKCADTTLHIYRRSLKFFSDFLLSELEGDSIADYKNIKRLHVVQFLDWMDKQQAKGRWSRATVLQILRSLRAFFRWVDRDEDCRAEGMAGLQRWLPSIEKTPQRTDIPQFSEIKKFRASFDLKSYWGHRNYVAVSLLLACGLRISELCSLRVDGIKWDQRFIVVTGKSGTRVVPVDPDILLILKGWLKKRAQCVQGKDSPFVFVGKTRPQMNANLMDQALHKVCVKHGFSRITPHTLRHVFCTKYLTKSDNMEKLRIIAGHKDYQVLKGYLHVAEMSGEDMQNDLERMAILKDF